VEIQTLIYIALFVFWILSKVASAKKTQKEVRPPPPPPRPRSETIIREARQITRDLGQLAKDMEAASPELSPEVRAQTQVVFERYLRAEAQRLRPVLEAAVEAEQEYVGAMDGVESELHDARALLSFYHDLLQAARSYTRLRGRAEFAPPRDVADRLVEEFHQPFGRFADSERLELALGPPLPLVQEAPSDRSTRGVIATFYVPPTVNFDLLEWSQVGEEMGYYLTSALPGIHEEIHESLELQTSPGPAGYDMDGLARLLFASWLGQAVRDSVGALLLGPSYVRAVALLDANPEEVRWVTTVHYTQEGIDPTTPPHVRVHLAAQWLERMGQADEAGEIRREWDGKHGSPDVLHLPNADLSLAPLLTSMSVLLDRLFDLELNALAGRRLSQLPGLADWNQYQRDALDARQSFLAGQPARGAARALVAGAIDAAIEERERTATIRDSLYQSIQKHPSRRRAAPGKKVARPVTAAKLATRPSARDFAEALILGEVLLEPRSR
jgi:hypothetical protein